jgi:uncharacterized NAD-dependent epimerase/dehydratase family protein
MIETPYLLFLGDAPDPLAAKVAQGVRDWRPDAANGQHRIESGRAGMGLPDGAVEWLTHDNDPDHWDLIEGQGSLFHASYSGVTLALIHGGQPDALVLCHEPTRAHMRGLPDHALPSLEALRGLSPTMARILNPEAVVVGAATNTAAMGEAVALANLAEVEARLGLPTVDPFRQGVERLVEAL